MRATLVGASKRTVKDHRAVRKVVVGSRKELCERGMTMPNTIRLHRVLRATPERIYRAFLDPDAMVKWLPPNGFTGKVHEMDA